MKHRLLWALLPVMVVLGAAAGYLAAGSNPTGNDNAITTPAHDHAITGGGHDQATPTTGSTTAAGHDHDPPVPSRSNTDTTGVAPADEHSGGHGDNATGASVATRTTVVSVFAALNLAILAVAALVRRRTPRTRTRRPAAQAA